MFSDFFSVVSLIALSVLSVLFILEKKKTKEKFSESHQNLITNVTQINKVISKNQDEISDKLSEQRSETNAILQEERSIAQSNKELLEKKIANNFERFGLTAREKFEGMEKKLAKSDEKFQQLANNFKDNFEELEEKVIENNDNLLNITASASRLHDDFEKNTSEKFHSLSDELISQAATISKLRADNDQLRKKLAVFTEIGSDSKQLNEIVDAVEEEKKLDEAVRDLKEKFSKKDKPKDIDSTTKQDTGKFDVDSILQAKVEIVTDRSSLDPEQYTASTLMETTNDHFFITGKAGTGKSFLLNAFVNASQKKTLKVSPTGIAALNIGGSTIHTAFGFDNLERLDVQDINSRNIKLSSNKKYVLREIDTLIIDEISMVRVDTFDKIDRILRVITENDLLFGGKQIIAFGDLFQLPPIITDNKVEMHLRRIYGGIYFFNSNAYRNGNFRFIELETNHRQNQDAEFFEILNRMREGNISNEDISLINKRNDGVDLELKRIVRLFPKKADAESVNREELNRIPSRLYTYYASIIYNRDNMQKINYYSNFPISPILTLKKGALVMMVNNDSDKRWVNGTLGIISNLSDEMIKVTINDTEYEVHPHIFESKEATINNGKIEYEVVLRIQQYPIILGYAITIHKSQGQTYQKLACDITKCFAPGQAYVALSRCSTLGGIHLLNRINGAQIAVDSDIKDFYLTAKQREYTSAF